MEHEQSVGLNRSGDLKRDLPRISRRKALLCLAAGVSTTILACENSRVPHITLNPETPNPSTVGTSTTTVPGESSVTRVIERPMGSALDVVRNNIMSFTNEEAVPLETFGLSYLPDGHVPFISLTNERLLIFVSASNSSYAFEYNLKSKSWSPFVNGESGEPIPATSPDNRVPFRSGYSAITSILRLDPNDPLKLWGITHNEHRKANDSGTFTASIGLVKSHDGGKTFDQGDKPLITGRVSSNPGKQVSGAGQPCAIYIEENGQKYINIYYVDWIPSDTSRKDLLSPDQIYLARIPVLRSGDIKDPEYYVGNNQFSADKMAMKPVIKVPSNIPDSGFAALPSVSYNTLLKKFLGVFATNIGFCAVTSEDGINWSDPEMVFKFTNSQTKVWGSGKKGQNYPTLLSFDQATDQVTDEKVSLIFADHLGPYSAHTLRLYEGSLK